MCYYGCPCKNLSGNSFPKSRGLRSCPRKSVYSCITVLAKNSKCTKALPECYETLQIHYMSYYGCPRKNSSGNSFRKSRGLRFRPRKSVYSCITVSAKNSKCTKALPECYEHLQIHYMHYYGCRCKNSSGNSYPKSHGLRFRPRKSVYSCITVSAKNSKCTKALPECYEICRSIICVIMGVHAEIHREILSLSHVTSISVLENRSTRA